MKLGVIEVRLRQVRREVTRGDGGRQGKIQKKENELNELDIGGCVGWTRIGIRGAGTHRTIVTYRTTKRREEEKKRRRE